jgi:hypothetical protein
MPPPTTAIYLNSTTPAAPPGNQNITFQSDGGQPSQSVTAFPQIAVTPSTGVAGLLGVGMPDGTTLQANAAGVWSVINPGTGGGTTATGLVLTPVHPSGAKDGSNTQFTLPAPPVANTFGIAFLDGVQLEVLGASAQYAVQGTQFTMALPPQSTDVLTYYYYQGTPNSETGGGGSVNPVGNPTFIQGASGYTTTGTNAVAFPSPNKAGDCLIVDMVGLNDNGGFSPSYSIHDSQGNSYAQIINQVQNNVFAISWVALNCAGGANTVTVAFEGGLAGNPINLGIHEYAAVATASALDTSAYAQAGTPGVPPLSVSVTTTVDGDLLHLFASAELFAGGVVFTETGGWNARESSCPTGSSYVPNLATWDDLAAAPGTYSDGVAVVIAEYLACYLIALKP